VTNGKSRAVKSNSPCSWEPETSAKSGKVRVSRLRLSVGIPEELPETAGARLIGFNGRMTCNGSAYL